MLFNSIEYFFFLPIVFITYWFVCKNLKTQNWLILLSSYVFYGWWDWKFLSLILISTIVDYYTGLFINKSKTKKREKIYLFISIFFNIGILAFFKYYNFFIESWVDMLNSFGYNPINTWTLKIILPVGISFYTFQTMSYSLDIYYKKIKPTKDFISFASFVSFFPQLVAGPIERASNLLPQILKKRKFNYKQSVDGLRLLLYGLFKKIVIADSLAPFVDNIFSNYQTMDAGTLLLGAIYFSFQIYADFSGYSDIAIGTAKILGFEIMSNFKFPYLSRNIGEFWKRWHISLSSWFRDYMYIPLGGSRVGKVKALRNIFIIFIISGFWHGANWTFIAWGLIHALLYIPLFITKQNRAYISDVVAQNKITPTIKEVAQVTTTFVFVCLAFVFFRSESVSMGVEYITSLFSSSILSFDNESGIIYCFVLFILDWRNRHNEREFIINNKLIRHIIYYLIIYLIIYKFSSYQSFIYFQF